jgi:hypothetical protein
MNARLQRNRTIVPKPLVLHPVSPNRAGTNPLHGRKRLCQPSASSSARLPLRRRSRRHRLSTSKRNRRRPRRKSRKRNRGSGISRSLQVSKGSAFKRSDVNSTGHPESSQDALIAVLLRSRAGPEKPADYTLHQEFSSWKCPLRRCTGNDGF